MQKLFTRILVPVAFTRSTKWSVEKAIQLANKFDCDILLLHVRVPLPPLSFSQFSLFSWSGIQYSRDEMRRKMNDLADQYRHRLKDGLLLNTAILEGHWQSVLKDVIIAEHIDLAVVPKSHRRFGSLLLRQVNINRLSQQTHCPVMTITRRFNIHQMQNIVVPVYEGLLVKKLSIATYLSLETSSCIYLMAADSQATAKAEERCLLRAYQLLNGYGKLNIHCALRDDRDMAAGTLAYARDVHADLIVINPGRESRLKGWWNQLRGKYLCRESDIPVMTVAY